MLDRPYVIVDLETTGGHITRDRITEVGLIEVDGESVTRWSALVNPGQPIPPFIQNITGISDAMVAGAPPFAELAHRLLQRLEGRLFVAHNARFDYGFLKNEFKRAGYRFSADVLCTVKLSRLLYPQYPKHNLDSLVARHHINLPAEMRHRALGDAQAVYDFLRAARTELGEAAVLNAVDVLSRKPAVPPGLDPELVDRLPDVPGVYRFYGEDRALLYVGKSNNIRSRVLAHFGGDHRSQKEMRLSQQVQDIDWIETVGEFGALLLEARLIKDMQPLHNVRGRREGGLCSLRLQQDDKGFAVPVVVQAAEVDFSVAGPLYGLFRNSREANKALEDMAEAYGLCRNVLGLERARGNRPCFGHQTGRCRGACVGREPATHHNMRLLNVLAKIRVRDWPYAGPIRVIETDPVSGEEAVHGFDRWGHLGSWRADEPQDARQDAGFDLDVYRLLNTVLKKPPANTRIEE